MSQDFTHDPQSKINPSSPLYKSDHPKVCHVKLVPPKVPHQFSQEYTVTSIFTSAFNRKCSKT